MSDLLMLALALEAVEKLWFQVALLLQVTLVP